MIPIFLLDMALGSDPGGNYGQFLLSGRCKAMRIRRKSSHEYTKSCRFVFFFFFGAKTLLFWFCISMDGCWLPPPALHILCFLEGHPPNCSLELGPRGHRHSLLSLLWEERTTSMPADLCLNLSLVDPILVSRSLLQDWASARCLYSWL